MNRNILPLIFIFTFLLSTILPTIFYQNTYAQNRSLEVSDDNVQLRDGPGLVFNVIDKLNKGEQLTYIDQNGDWYHVKYGKQEGWVAAWLTSPHDNSSQNADNTTMISQVDHLNIRSEPSISAVVLGQLSSGQQATVLTEQDEWVQISRDDVTGWVSKQYVTLNEQQSKGTENNDATNNDISNLNEQGPQYFTIKVDALHIREEADLNAKIITTVNKGQSYKILERQKNWLQIQLPDDNKGWVYSFYGTITTGHETPSKSDEPQKEQYVTILYNGTNLREQPTTSANVVTRVDAGDVFKINQANGDWYNVQINDSQTAFVASWVVTVTNNEGTQINTTDDKPSKPKRKKGSLKGVTIVVDAGHGGNDQGTTGARGTEEKGITLQTATILASKLSAAGANVIMTRDSDQYVDLRKRVSIAHQQNADAFISIHYDATDDSTISGFTTYYFNSYQQPLAETVHKELTKKMPLRDRGAQPGNYLVLRENQQPAILIELGFLSNAGEERIIKKNQFREQATNGIYNGIIKYFDNLLEE